jgi:hypothetical protein
MVPEVKQIDLLDFNVEVTKPLVDITHVPALNILELIHIPVNISVKHWQFEFALTNVEIAVNNREGTPSEDQVLAGILAGEVNEFEDKYVGGDEGLRRGQHEVELVPVEINGVLLLRVMSNNVTVNFTEV